MKAQGDFVNYAELDKIIIGVCGGDGIGPAITGQAQRILEFLLEEEVEKGRVEFKVIDGLTIERRAALQKAIPDDTLAELKECHVILKGPTTTPRKGDPWPNVSRNLPSVVLIMFALVTAVTLVFPLAFAYSNAARIMRSVPWLVTTVKSQNMPTRAA